MPPLRTTLGQLLVNEALPEQYRDYNRVLDKKGMHALLRNVAETSPEQYKDVSKRLADVGRHVATRSGGNSFSLEHMLKAKSAHKIGVDLQSDIDKILNNDNLTDQQRHELIIRKTGAAQERQMKDVYAESLAENNPLARQVQSGSRGNEMNLASLRGSDMLYTDHHDNVIPLPVIRSYSQGLTPAEYWAGTYGARKGVMATKFATQDAGFLSKQLNQVSHRLMVSDLDHEQEYPANRGLPVDVDDMDSEGALLAQDVGPYKRHTMLTPKILKHMKSLGNDRILVRSALVGGSPDGGVYSRDVGVRERGGLPGRGEQIGLQAAQALSEPLQQGQLSAKHSGGVAGQEKAVSGFDAVNQLIQAPKTFKGGAAHATLDGTVQRVEDAPAGGSYVTIDGQQHYVGRGYDLKVKPGDKVEAGDTISEGWPNPATVIEHKGIGEGRRYFVDSMRDAMKGAGLKVNRRNLEVLSRGLINHVRLTEEHGEHVPDDVVPYSTLEHTYEPREGHEVLPPKRALGQYLERPILHYTIGTKVRPSMLKELEHFGVGDITVHKEPPPFQAEMIRGMANVAHDPDWMTRMYGSGQKASLLDAAHRGGTSNELGTSFVPGLSRAVDFGRVGMVRQPEPTSKPDLAGPSTPRPSAKADPAMVAPPEPKKAKSRSSLLKWSEDKKARLIKTADNPATPGVPAPAKQPEPQKPPPAPQVSPPTGTSTPATPPPAPTPSTDYVGGTGSAATTAGIQQKAQQNGPTVYNGGFQPSRNYLTGMDPSHAQQHLEEGGIGAIGHGLDQNAWAVLTGQAKGHNMQFNGVVPGYGGRGGYPGTGPFGDGEDENYSYTGAHPGGGVMPNRHVPGVGWQDAAQAFTDYAVPAATVTGLGATGLGWTSRMLGGFGLLGDNKLVRGGKTLGTAGSAISRFVTPIQVALGLGEDVGNTIKDVREGKFFSPEGQVNQQNTKEIQQASELGNSLLLNDKPSETPITDVGLSLLQRLNPVSNARVVGAGSVELARALPGTGAAMNTVTDEGVRGYRLDVHNASLHKDVIDRFTATPPTTDAERAQLANAVSGYNNSQKQRQEAMSGVRGFSGPDRGQFEHDVGVAQRGRASDKQQAQMKADKARLFDQQVGLHGQLGADPLSYPSKQLRAMMQDPTYAKYSEYIGSILGKVEADEKRRYAVVPQTPEEQVKMQQSVNAFNQNIGPRPTNKAPMYAINDPNRPRTTPLTGDGYQGDEYVSPSIPSFKPIEPTVKPVPAAASTAPVTAGRPQLSPDETKLFDKFQDEISELASKYQLQPADCDNLVNFRSTGDPKKDAIFDRYPELAKYRTPPVLKKSGFDWLSLLR